jgi:hypothetical protein
MYLIVTLQEVVMKRSLFRIALSLATLLSFAFVSAALAGVSENVVLWLQFDEDGGDVASDSSQYGNDGQIVGPEWVEGKYGSALSFDGSNDYVKVGSTDELQLSEEGLTIATWFKTDEKAGQDLMFIEKGPWDPGEYALSYPGYANFRVRFQIYEIYGKESNQIDSVSGVPELSDNEWHYAAGVYDAVNSVFRVYVDGELEEEQGANPHVFTPDDQPVYVGTRNITGNWYRGAIDELLIANIPFTAAQLNAHMEGNLLAAVQPENSLSVTWGQIKEGQ